MANSKKKAPGTWTRDLEKEKFWRKTIAEYAVSGLSIHEFCNRKDIATGSFGAWKRELQMRDRECIAAGDSDTTPLPSFPRKVKDSRGRLIPTRVREWVQETKSKDNENLSPFVPLKLVGPPATAETNIPVDAQSTTQIEVVSPGGFTIRLNDQADAEFVSKLLHSLEAKRC